MLFTERRLLIMSYRRLSPTPIYLFNAAIQCKCLIQVDDKEVTRNRENLNFTTNWNSYSDEESSKTLKKSTFFGKRRKE